MSIVLIGIEYSSMKSFGTWSAVLLVTYGELWSRFLSGDTVYILYYVVPYISYRPSPVPPYNLTAYHFLPKIANEQNINPSVVIFSQYFVITKLC
jgi:hypothetical protein